MQAAFGNSQLKNIDRILKRREEIANLYVSLLKDSNQLVIPYSLKHKRSWFFFFIILPNVKIRDRICKRLTECEIGSIANFFPPIYTFPMYAKYAQSYFHNTEKVSKTLLILPMFYNMQDKEVKKVAMVVRSVLKNNG